MPNCKEGYRIRRKRREVKYCVREGARFKGVCASGQRLPNGKCKRMPLTEAQKARARQMAKARTMGKKAKQKRAFGGLKRYKRDAPAAAAAPAANPRGSKRAIKKPDRLGS